MRGYLRILIVIGVIFLYFYIFPKESYAYLDPGSGSYILQLLVASLLGLLFSLKLFWNRIRIFIANIFSKLKRDGRK